MTMRTVRLLVLCGFLVAGVSVGLQAQHAVAGVYDLNKEMVLEGRLKKLNFTNPHASIELTIPNKDGTGRVLAMEIMTNTPAVAALIRDAKTFMLPGVIRSTICST